MNDDLISREALKKKIDEVQYTQEFCIEHHIDYSISMQMLGMIIDNAPTVKYPFYQEAYQSGYEEGYLKGVKVGNDQKRKICDSCKIHERPQGEWIEKYSDYGVYYRCSICHKMPPNYDCDYKEGAIKTNFCPNCGAEMKGGAEE